MHYVVYDVETRSVSSLKQVGSHVYSCDPTTDFYCLAYCIVTDGTRGPIITWLPSDPVPADILAAAADPETLIVAFTMPSNARSNSAFFIPDMAGRFSQ